MQYRVVTVADDELPKGTDWALVRAPNRFYLFVRDGRLSAALLDQTWPAFVRMTTRQPSHVA